MKSNWIIYNKSKDASSLVQKFGIKPLTSVILCNRDITNDNEVKMILSSEINDLNDEKLLPDIDKAVSLIKKHIEKNNSIRIVGDYDIDGVTATYILYDAIKSLGGNVSYDIPDRVLDGYGINNRIIDKAIEDKVNLIITCDNGISANDQIKYAKSNGIDVVVTDHHDIGTLPNNADAIIDPKRTDLEIKYPFTEICGAVVAWKLVMCLIGRENAIKKYLEFAMIATIGDIMPLINENHIITKLGLTKILFTENKGLKKLLDVTGIDFLSKGINSYHIGFIIGPLINAAGRMEHASIALKLFLSNDSKEIDELAFTLKSLNDKRKAITEDGAKLADSKIEKYYKDDKIFVVFVEGVEESVAGIVAGRIKEKYNRPTIILTDTKDSDTAKASCRSIDAYHMFDSLDKHHDMFLTFGGHKLAAGFSIKKSDIDILRRLLNEETTLTESDFMKKVYIDYEYDFTDIDTGIIDDIERLAPFGQGFTRPTFATKDTKIAISNIFGENKNVIKLSLTKGNKSANGIIFMDSIEFKDSISEKDSFSILYYPKINEYRGYRNVDINLIEYRSIGK